MYWPFVKKAYRASMDQYKQDPSNNRKEIWYNYCRRSWLEFINTVESIARSETYFDERNLDEVIARTRKAHILDQGTISFYKLNKEIIFGNWFNTISRRI